MEARKLTPLQIDLLRMFAYNPGDEFAMEIRTVLHNHLQQKLDEELDKLWDSGQLDQAALDKIRTEDLHKYLRR